MHKKRDSKVSFSQTFNDFSYSKKGQITVFIILGILLLLAFILVFTLKSEIIVSESTFEKKIVENGIEKGPVGQHIESCLRKVLTEGVRQISFYGGYFYPSGLEEYQEAGDGGEFYDHYYFGGVQLPYLLNKDKIILREINDIEEKLSNYVLVELGDCLDTFTAFQEGVYVDHPELGLNGGAEVLVNVQEDFVLVELQWPVKVKKGESVTTLDVFQSKVDLRLGRLYGLVRDLLNDVREEQPFDLGEHCEDSLSGPEYEKINIYLDSNLYTYEYVLRVVDAKYLEEGKAPLKFQFAVKNVNIEGECVG
jgi:hypothetical protein